jgi:hypothetical protein
MSGGGKGRVEGPEGDHPSLKRSGKDVAKRRAAQAATCGQRGSLGIPARSRRASLVGKPCLRQGQSPLVFFQGGVAGVSPLEGVAKDASAAEARGRPSPLLPVKMSVCEVLSRKKQFDAALAR